MFFEKSGYFNLESNFSVLESMCFCANVALVFERLLAFDSGFIFIKFSLPISGTSHLLKKRININSLKPNNSAVPVAFKFAGLDVISNSLDCQFKMCCCFLNSHPFICNHEYIISFYIAYLQVFMPNYKNKCLTKS